MSFIGPQSKDAHGLAKEWHHLRIVKQTADCPSRRDLVLLKQDGQLADFRLKKGMTLCAIKNKKAPHPEQRPERTADPPL